MLAVKNLLYFILLFPVSVLGQTSDNSVVFKFYSSHTSFPDTLRTKGYRYNDKYYAVTDHYFDSSVSVIVPPHFKSHKKVDLVFWFHGWYNTIDSSNKIFRLQEQFISSGKNAILVIPEEAVNAPDSYGGKLEQSERFNFLVYEVLEQLKNRSLLHKNTRLGNIVLAGHSGAYRVIAHILDRGGVEVQEVILFDGLYGQVDKFEKWITSKKEHHFVHLFTSEGGGTEEVSYNFMKKLQDSVIAFSFKEEYLVKVNDLKRERVLFIKSKLGHNEVLSNTNWWLRLVKNAHFLR